MQARCMITTTPAANLLMITIIILIENPTGCNYVVIEFAKVKFIIFDFDGVLFNGLEPSGRREVRQSKNTAEGGFPIKPWIKSPPSYRN